MVGDKIYKSDVDWSEKYTEEAIWCNSNDAHIEDKGSYYEVCENVEPIPSIDEQIAQLDMQYNSDKAVLTEQYSEADMLENYELKASLKVELATLQAEYDRAYEEIIGGGE